MRKPRRAQVHNAREALDIARRIRFDGLYNPPDPVIGRWQLPVFARLHLNRRLGSIGRETSLATGGKECRKSASPKARSLLPFCSAPFGQGARSNGIV